jgi:hypothetical protein
MPFGSWAYLILLAKSETPTIQGRHALVYSVCQSASPSEHDFASSIIFGEVESMGISTRGMEKLSSSDGGVFLPSSGREHVARPPNDPVSPKLAKSLKSSKSVE